MLLFCPKYSWSPEISNNFSHDNDLHVVAFWGDDGEIFQLSVVCQGQRHSRGQNSPFSIQCPCHLRNSLCVTLPATYNYIVPYVTGPVEHPVYMCILLHFIPSIHQFSFSRTFYIIMYIYIYTHILLHFLPSIHQCSFSGTSYIYVYIYIYICILLHFLRSIHQCSFSGTSCIHVHITSLLTKYSLM